MTGRSPSGSRSSVLKVILASQSPRRRDLLNLIGIDHEVYPADVNESLFAGESPVAHATRLARAKALTLAQREPSALIIAADTIVVVDDDVLGKPAHEADAHRMLRMLSGREHIVVTAVAVALDGDIVSTADEVRVTFRKLTDTEIGQYIATGEPMDKAGAYGIQGFGATIVGRIDGDYFAVMGLPVTRVVELMGQVGVRYCYGGGLTRDTGAKP